MKTRKKQVCVIGLGQFGWELAISFSQLAEVLVIDANQALVNSIAERVHNAVVMDARDFDGLASLVTPEFDEGVVCLSESMESSILAVLHLKRIGVKRVHAKARNRDHATILEAIGADSIIFPERDTARRLVQKVLNPDLLDYVPISDDYSVMQIAPPSEFVGRSLLELDLRRHFGVFVIAMRDPESDMAVFLPGPEAVVMENMTLVVIGRPDDVDAMRAHARRNPLPPGAVPGKVPATDQAMEKNVPPDGGAGATPPSDGPPSTTAVPTVPTPPPAAAQEPVDFKQPGDHTG